MVTGFGRNARKIHKDDIFVGTRLLRGFIHARTITDFGIPVPGLSGVRQRGVASLYAKVVLFIQASGSGTIQRPTGICKMLRSSKK
jgi:hypothetical protein